MATQTNVSTRIGNALPAGVKGRLLTGIFAAYGRLAATRTPYEYLFLLSHVRAGSSLLSLILGNNPDICGYGETMLSYRSADDLRLLTGNNLYRLQPWRLPGNERFMFDKLVFDHLLAPDKVPMLAEKRSRFVFLIREPAGAIRSLMPKVKGEDDTLATSLYVLRLNTLEQYAAHLRGYDRAFLLTYEDLLERTETTFSGLAAHLGLREPLSETYDVLRPMKVRTASHYKKMHYGQIDRGGPASPQAPIGPRNLEVAWNAYNRCWSALSAVSVLASGATG